LPWPRRRRSPADGWLLKDFSWPIRRDAVDSRKRFCPAISETGKSCDQQRGGAPGAPVDGVWCLPGFGHPNARFGEVEPSHAAERTHTPRCPLFDGHRETPVCDDTPSAGKRKYFFVASRHEPSTKASEEKSLPCERGALKKIAVRFSEHRE
jgi:hypothetical protein